MENLESQIRDMFEKYENDTFDEYGEKPHEFETYLQNIIETHSDTAFDIIDDCIFNYQPHYKSIIMSICVYGRGAMKNGKDSEYYKRLIRILGRFSKKSSDEQLNACVVAWLYEFNLDDSLEKILKIDINDGLKRSISLYLTCKAVKEKFNITDKENYASIETLIGAYVRHKFIHNTTNTSSKRESALENVIERFGVEKTAKIIHYAAEYNTCPKDMSLNVKNLINDKRVRKAYLKCDGI